MDLLFFKRTTPWFNWFHILLFFTIHFINLYPNLITSCYLLHLGLTSSSFPRTLRCFIRLFVGNIPNIFNVSTLSINFLLRTVLSISQRTSKFYSHFLIYFLNPLSIFSMTYCTYKIVQFHFQVFAYLLWVTLPVDY